MIIAVDFDGTIVEHKFPKIGPELPGAIEALKDLQEAGHKVILWSIRDGKTLDEALEFLKGRGFTPDAANKNLVKFSDSPKVYADFYIDDRSIPPFRGWDYVRRIFGLRKASAQTAPIRPGTPDEGAQEASGAQEKKELGPEDQEAPKE